MGIGVSVLLARRLGPEDYGIYALSLSILIIFFRVSLLGMDKAVLRFFPLYTKKADELKGLIHSVFLFVFFLSIGGGGAGWLCADQWIDTVFGIPRLHSAFSFCMLFLPFMAANQIVAVLFQARKDMVRFIGYSDLYQKLIQLLIIIVIGFTGFSLSKAVFSYGISVCAVSLFALFSYRKCFYPLISGGKPHYQIDELINFSIPSLFVGLGFILLMQVDRIMVGIYMTSYDVGIYAVCAKISMFMNIVLVAVNGAFVPYISELYFTDRKNELESIYKAVTKLTWIFSILLFVFFFWASDYLLTFFGAEFIAGKTAFIILSFFFLLNCGFGSNGFMLQMTGNQRVEFINSTIALILNIILNIMLIPRWGVNGAAFATGGSLFVINISRLISFCKISHIHPLSRGWFLCLYGFVAFFVIFLLLQKHIQNEHLQHLLPFVGFCSCFSIFIWKVVLQNEERHLVCRLFR